MNFKHFIVDNNKKFLRTQKMSEYELYNHDDNFSELSRYLINSGAIHYEARPVQFPHLNISIIYIPRQQQLNIPPEIVGKDDTYSQDKHKYCDCSVCMNQYTKNDEIKILSCGHIFHTSCIMQWVQTNYNGNCPNCRANII